MGLMVGVDFDNTIVNYGNIMHQTAMRWGLIDDNVDKNKRVIRNSIRQLPNGENAWLRLQAFVYGLAMDKAVLFEGITYFFQACRNAKIDICIISHKTNFLEIEEDGGGANLWDLAITWMKKNAVFEENGLGLSQENAYFEPTVEAKIERIKRSGCTHFIDDTEEIFLEKSFPEHVKKILFALPLNGAVSPKWKTLDTWRKINEYFFSERS